MTRAICSKATLVHQFQPALQILPQLASYIKMPCLFANCHVRGSSAGGLLAATVGVVTETNAEKAIEELKAYEVQCVFHTDHPKSCPAHAICGLSLTRSQQFDSALTRLLTSSA